MSRAPRRLLELAALLGVLGAADRSCAQEAQKVTVLVQCPSLAAFEERIAAFETRARLELALSQQTGTIELKCPGQLLVNYTPTSGTTQQQSVSWAPDESLDDRLIAALNLLTSRANEDALQTPDPKPQEQRRAPSMDASRLASATKETLAWGLRGGPGIEAWSPDSQVAWGGELQVVAGWRSWQFSGGGGALHQSPQPGAFHVDAYRLRVSVERALLKSHFIFDVGLTSSVGIFRAFAPPGLAPETRLDWGLSVASSAKAGYARGRWRATVGPEVAANLVRPRAFVGDELRWQQSLVSFGATATLTRWF